MSAQNTTLPTTTLTYLWGHDSTGTAGKIPANSKLDTSVYTPADVLAKLKSVDGASSGLDADLVRGTTPSTTGLGVLGAATQAAARTALGLGSAALSDAAAFATAAQGVKADGALQANNNLSDLNNLTTARTNLGVYSTSAVDTALAAKANSSDLAAISAAQAYMVRYNAQTLTEAQAKQVRTNMLGGFGPADAIIEDQRASGTNGTALGAGIQQVPLNTVVRNVNSHVTLASNQFTVDVDMDCEAMFASGSDRCQALIYDITASAYVGVGLSQFGNSTYDARPLQYVKARLTGGHTYELRRYAQTSATPYAVSAGQGERYATVSFWRV